MYGSKLCWSTPNRLSVCIEHHKQLFTTNQISKKRIHLMQLKLRATFCWDWGLLILFFLTEAL